MRAFRLSHYVKVGLFYTLFYLVFFSPIIFSDRIFLSDGLHPAFFSPFELWTNQVFAGYPAVAAIESQDLYPLTYVFSELPGGFNLFILSVYILSSFFVYGYIYTIIRSTFAGLVAGVMFGLSGFMIAHLGHGSMIHAATWLPLLIWSLEKLKRTFSYLWLSLASLAVALSFLAGHPQISVYSVILSSAYVLILGRSATIGWTRYIIVFFIILAVGCLLAAVQLLPTLELMSQSVRSKMSFEQFVSYALPLQQVVQLMFPYVFGGSGSPYVASYFGDWNLTELTGFVGIVTLFFAVIGSSRSFQNKLAMFWTVTGIVMFLLALGDSTPIAKLMYHLPIVNKFRAPARHFLEMTFAINVLAAIGIHRLQTFKLTKILVFRMVICGSAVIMISLLVILLNYGRLTDIAINHGVEIPSSHKIVSLIIPCFIFTMHVGAIVFWSRKLKDYLRQAIVLVIIIIDLGSFSWFYDWKYSSPNASALYQPHYAKRYEQILADSHQRFLPLDGYKSRAFPGTLSRLFKISSISGYGPFLLNRFSELTTISNAGTASPLILASRDRVLDLLSVRFVSMQINRDTIFEKGIVWSSDDLNIALGSGCDPHNPNEIRFVLPRSIEATKIVFVSSLGCSTLIEDEDEVVEIKLTDTNQRIVKETLRAGRDTSEWGVDCPDVRPHMQHSRARVFRSWEVSRAGVSGGCQGHSYFTTIELAPNIEAKEIDLRYSSASGSIGIHKLSLINDKTNVSRPLWIYEEMLGQREGWQHVENINDSYVFENIRAMPRVWLVPEVLRAEPEAIFKAIRHSILPDGRTFEPSQIALVEEPLTFRLEQPDPFATATIVKHDSMSIEIQTDSRSPAFLVLSDIYYPGWEATIDGVHTHIFRTNYILRGILVPAGVHIIRFDYSPMNFYWGALISTLTLLILAASLTSASLRRKGSSL
jgi:hypothetical protein